MLTKRSPGISLMLIMIAIFVIPAYTLAQKKAFSGLYAGFEIGQQNIIGGSLIENVDFLAQENRAVSGLQAGVRLQLDLGIVFGIEGSLGFMDGNLSLADPANQLDITYENDSQTTLGLTGGFAFGAKKDWLLFGYLSEATRSFDVTIDQAGVIFAQRDEQGMLRYGIGVEKQFFGHLNLCLSAGTGRADFGDRQTNIDVKRKFEFSIGGFFQL